MKIWKKYDNKLGPSGNNQHAVKYNFKGKMTDFKVKYVCRKLS